MGSGGVGSPKAAVTIFKPLKRFLENKNLFFTAPRNRACSPREAGVRRC